MQNNAFTFLDKHHHRDYIVKQDWRIRDTISLEIKWKLLYVEFLINKLRKQILKK